MKTITFLIIILTSSIVMAQYPFENGLFQEIEYEKRALLPSKRS